MKTLAWPYTVSSVSLRRNGPCGQSVGLVAVCLDVSGACCVYFAVAPCGANTMKIFINILVDGMECTFSRFMIIANWGAVDKPEGAAVLMGLGLQRN